MHSRPHVEKKLPMSKSVRLSLTFVSIMLLASPASGQGPPINTDTPILLGLGGAGVRSFAKVTRKSKPDNDLTVFVSPVVLPYNVTTEFLVGALFPYFTKDLDNNGTSLTSSGFGDMKLFAKYLLLQIDRPQETLRLLAKGTVKLPTGDEKLGPPLALGTGTTDYAFSAVVGWIKPRVGFYAEGIYSLNTSRGGTEYGDSFGHNLAVGYRLYPTTYKTYPSPQLSAYLELNGVTTGRNEEDGRSVDDSGGTTILLSPGLQYVGGRRWLVESSFQYPIVEKPNGTQLETDFSLSLGVRVLLF